MADQDKEKKTKKVSSSSVSTETASPCHKQTRTDSTTGIDVSFDSIVDDESEPKRTFDMMMSAHFNILHERLDKIFESPAFTNSVKNIIDISIQKEIQNLESRIESRMNDHQEKIEKVESNLMAVQLNNDELRSELASASSTIHELQNKIKRLESDSKTII